MRLFFKYLYQYRKSALFFIAFTVIFAAVFAIYNVQTEAVLYAFSICFAVGAVSVICGFVRFRKRNRLMEKIHKNLPLMTDKLPLPKTADEENLQGIISELAEINRQNINEMNHIRKDNTDYFTVWVHQIKTPISAMQMILQTEDSEISRELSAELFRVEQYAEMALHYIRLDSRSNDFVFQKYDLDSIIKQAVHRYAPLFIRRRIKLDYQPVNVKVLTDKKWLEFVIEQILSNGIKYTLKGCVSIRFGDNTLSISDTGIGIPAEDLPRIFEKGYTGLSGRRNKKSTGLGLYLCKTVCDKLGHKLYAESQVGSGSTFYIDLNKSEFDIE